MHGSPHSILHKLFGRSMQYGGLIGFYLNLHVPCLCSKGFNPVQLLLLLTVTPRKGKPENAGHPGFGPILWVFWQREWVVLIGEQLEKQ